MMQDDPKIESFSRELSLRLAEKLERSEITLEKTFDILADFLMLVRNKGRDGEIKSFLEQV